MHLYCHHKVVLQVSIDGTNEYTNSKTRGKNHFDIVYNCEYFHFAKNYFYSKLIEKLTDIDKGE